MERGRLVQPRFHSCLRSKRCRGLGLGFENHFSQARHENLPKASPSLSKWWWWLGRLLSLKSVMCQPIHDAIMSLTRIGSQVSRTLIQTSIES